MEEGRGPGEGGRAEHNTKTGERNVSRGGADVNRDANVNSMEEPIEEPDASSHQRKSGARGLMTPASDRVIVALATCESTWHEYARLLQNNVGRQS